MRSIFWICWLRFWARDGASSLRRSRCVIHGLSSPKKIGCICVSAWMSSTAPFTAYLYFDVGPTGVDSIEYPEGGGDRKTEYCCEFAAIPGMAAETRRRDRA